MLGIAFALDGNGLAFTFSNCTFLFYLPNSLSGTAGNFHIVLLETPRALDKVGSLVNRKQDPSEKQTVP